jgi:hypothetical protein
VALLFVALAGEARRAAPGPPLVVGTCTIVTWAAEFGREGGRYS